MTPTRPSDTMIGSTGEQVERPGHRNRTGATRVKDRESIHKHLSQINTSWNVLRLAHAGGGGGPGPAQAEARGRLVDRYGTSVYTYLLGSLRDRDAADELFQEFALKLVRGDFHRADPAKGRFRDFLKTALFRLIVDAQRRRKSTGPAVEGLAEGAAADRPGEEAERRFLDAWRDELLARAWDALADHEAASGRPLHTVLKLRAERPEMRSPEMAERLSEALGRAVNAAWVRKKLFQARERYTDALVEAVTQSLAEPTRENVEQELIDLGLQAHCREALDRRGADRPTPGV